MGDQPMGTMKFTALALCLASTQAITLWTTTGEIAYEENDEEETNVQLSDWHAGQAGTLGNAEYARVVTPRFAADDDDIFMRSMIKNYAIEKATDDKENPVPTGKFIMNEATMRAAASEFLCTHTTVKLGDISMSTRPEKLK